MGSTPACMAELPGARRTGRPGRPNGLGCGILVAPVLALAGFVVLGAKAWHPSDAAFPEQGIDVSHHQGTIDWAALPAQGVDFAYIKATEGGDHVDREFLRNWLTSADAGVKRGAYHFFTLCRSGAEQAANFIANVPVDAAALPPAVDLEFLGNCSERPKMTDVNAEVAAFLGLIEAHYGRPAVIYLTEEFDEAYGVSSRFDRPLWLRSLVLEPDFGARPWALWQASNFRRLDGIEGRVDWNVARPDAD